MYLYYILLLFLIILCESTKGKKCMGSGTMKKECTKIEIGDKNIKMNCSRCNLDTVPSCNDSCSRISELILTQNNIINLQKGVFLNYSSLRLLDLSYNKIGKIQDGLFSGLSLLQGLNLSHILPKNYLVFDNETFRPLVSLKWIDISSSVVDKSSLCSSFCSVSASELDYLNLNNLSDVEYTKLHYVTEEMTRCFRNITVKRITIENCQIQGFSVKSMRNLRTIEELSVRRNFLIMEFVTIGVVGLQWHNITYFNAGCQDSPTCVDKYPWSDWIPNMPLMFESGNTSNSIQTLNEENLTKNPNVTKVYFLPKLATIIGDHISNVIRREFHLFSLCWANNHLVNVDVSFVTTLLLEGTAYCMNYLRYVNLRGLTKLAFPENVLHEMPNLEVIMFGSSKFTQPIFSKKSASLIFERNRKLTFLDMSNLKIKRLHPDIFRNQVNLEYLILSRNKLDNLDPEIVANLKSLHHLDLSSNKLTKIPLETLLLMEKANKTYVNLDNNPFICDCNSISKIEGLLNLELFHKIVIKDININHTSLGCLLPNMTAVSFPNSLKILRQQCLKPDTVSKSFLMVVYPLILFVILSSTCCYRHKLKVYFIWYKTVGLLCVEQEDVQNLHFDAFVAYAQDDENWVRGTLLKKLESGNKSYSLCIHDRNFLPGHYISDTIITAIKESRKTILVVTKSFVKSKWCTFETRAAQAHHLRSNSGVIAIVFPGVHQISSKNQPLRELLDLVSYLEWPEDFEQQSVFWLRLCRALGKPMFKSNHANYSADPIKV